MPKKVKQALSAASKLEIKIIGEYLEITIPISFRSAFGRKLAFDASGKPADIMQEHNTDITLIKALGKSYKWNKMLESGEVKSAEELARKENTDIGNVSRTLSLLSLSSGGFKF